MFMLLIAGGYYVYITEFNCQSVGGYCQSVGGYWCNLCLYYIV